MKTLWNDADYRDLCDRLGRLTPQNRARWGGMSAAQAVVHLCDAFRMANGELPVTPKRLPIRFFPLKQLIIYVLPFPKGAPTAPELLDRPPGDWQSDLADLRTAMDGMLARGPSGCTVDHPAFGRLSPRGWGVLAYRHTDHHLRQFGV